MTLRLSVFVVFLALTAAACFENLDDSGVSETVAPIEPETVEQPIVNGTDTPLITNLSAGEELAIVFLADRDGDPFCSGTLITNDAVLTALHCVDDLQLEDIRVGIGQPTSPRALIPLRRLSEADWETDVALLQLDRGARSAVASLTPIPFNRDVLGPELVGTDVEVSGYHAVSGVSRRRYAVLEVTNVSDLSTKADGFGARGACQGDSGGPMLLHDGAGDPRVGGTAIGGASSCIEHVYFSRVDLLSDWIDDELAWFASDAGGTAGGSSQGSRRIPDPCACSPAQGLPDLWTAVLVLLAGLVLVRRRASAV